MKIKLVTIITTILAVQGFTALRCTAQSVPNLINYQGRLTDQTGAALTQGLYQIQFRLWDSATATNASDLIWGQQQTLPVQSGGVFATILGSGGTSIPGANPAVNDLSFAFTQSNRYIGVTVVSSNGVTLSGASEILPRQQILSAPYAVTASFASVAQNAINGVPAGSVMSFAGAVTPAGWLLCDGTAISRTVYSNLFLAIGTSYGAGDGSTTFALPDLRGRVATGYDSGQAEFSAYGKTGGQKTHSLIKAELASHSHFAYLTGFGSSSPGNGIAIQGAFVPNNCSYNQTFLDSGPNNDGLISQPFGILSPYIVLNYIIKM